MTNRHRTHRGTYIAEVPAVLTVLVVSLGFPLVDLASITLQSTWVKTVVRRATEDAAKKHDLIEAKTEVQQIIKKHLNSVGISTKSPIVEIVVLRGAKTTPGKFAPMTHPDIVGNSYADGIYRCMDPDSNVCNLKVSVTATITPLLMFNKSLFGNVPGLTKPFEITETAQTFFEHPEGLFDEVPPVSTGTSTATQP